jgi:UDP-N-acetylmuramoylalanine--D-glutamate ligase
VRALPSGFVAEWAQLKIAVLGLGASGFSAADTLAELGVQTAVFAKSGDSEFAEILDVLGVALVRDDGDQAVAELEKMRPDFVLVSPGFRPDHPLVRWAYSSSEVITDIDIAWALGGRGGKRPEWITVTGTNGKTTTVELTEAMLQAAGLRAVACGNIGNPILDAVRDPIGFDVLVVELSSFQLHYSRDLEAAAAAYLNLASDHIDWHGSFEEYAASKAKVFEGVRVAGVYNVGDTATERALEDAEVTEGARAIGFTLGTPARSMVGYVEGILVDRAFLEDRANSALEIAAPEDIERIGIISPHLLQNLAASTALARALGAPPAAIREAIRSFKLSPHRIQLVREIDAVSFVDDSKATNTHAARASLASFDSVVLIAGGLFKGVDPTPLLAEFAQRIRAIVMIGTDDTLREAAAKANIELTPIQPGPEVMARAVAAAAEIAKPGDTVLLAPAAASQDQFVDYKDRGNQFQRAVLGLGGAL